MKITLRPVQTYEVEIAGRKLGAFRVDSSWNGQTRLCSERGNRILIVRTVPAFEETFSVIADVAIETDLIEAPECPDEVVRRVTASSRRQHTR